MNDQSKQITDCTPEDLIQMKSIGNVQISPDGTQTAFTIRQTIMTKDKSSYLTHIFEADKSNKEMTQLTFGEHSCTKPRWSPDGSTIAFTSNQSGKSGLYFLDVNSGEIQQFLEVETSINDYKWSPDGQRIALVMPDPPQNESTEQKNDANVVEEHMTMNRLWIVSTKEKAESRALTPSDLHINTCFGGSPFDWSPDGRIIAFSHTPTPWVDDWIHGDISTIDIETKKIRPLAHTKASERSPLYSPDGKWIAYQKSDDPPTWYSTFDLYVIPSAGGEPRLLAESTERWSDIIGWAADSQSIYFTEIQGLISCLCEVTLQGERHQFAPLADGTVTSVSMNQSGSSISFIHESLDRPREIYASNIQNFKPHQITQFHKQIPSHPLGKTQVIRYDSSENVEIDGLLTYPVNYQEDTRYPLLVIIHGGPMGMFTQTFDAQLTSDDPYPLATFSTNGYAILRCNVRGSSGYSKAFLRSNYRDWGGVDYDDIMAGVDYVIQMGVADPERLGIMGWSYGGYLTGWTITQTNRFKAASIGAGLFNLTSSVGTTSIPTCTTDYFGAEIWEDIDIYLERSPMTHVKNVSTPTLIQSFEQDDIVSVTQGYEFYHALKKLNIPTQLITYPRMGHGLREPKLLLDFANRNLAWFDQHLGRVP